MQRARRAKKNSSLKNSIYLYAGIILFLIVATIVTFVIFNNRMQKNLETTLGTQQITGLIPSLSTDDFAETSMGLSKTVEEAKETIENVETDSNLAQIAVEETNTNVVETSKTENLEIKEEEVKEVIVPDPEFIMPVEGEIVREYAKDNLIFSETLQEWITHTGIDIKADRTSVVKSAEAGKVIAIKNDPRYGLTVIIEHTNNYKTIYSNLLTTEFIVEGEEIEKGQSIGTIGNSAVFEIADEPHLHFEMTKDDVNVDPTMYLK